MEIANFKYKEKEYIFVLENNEIKYGYKENGELNTNLTTEEDDMMKYIMSKIFISSDAKNHYKYGKTIHNGKLFQVMYDEVSEKKFFYEIVNNEYKFPKLEDNIYLYEKFNSYVLCTKNDNYRESKKHKEFKKIRVRVNKTVTLFAILLNVLLYSSVECNNTIKYLLMDSVHYDEEINEIEMEESLKKNKNLTEEEKDEFRKFYTMVEENKEYINPNIISDNLKNYSIKYSSKKKRGVGGDNNSLLQHINIYGKSSYEETVNDDWYKKALSHEVCHSFQGLVSDGLSEAINEELNAEYVTDEACDYYEERMCLYSLCEIVNPDCFKSYYFKGDKDSLIEELTLLIDDKAKAYELIGNIDSYKENRNESFKCETEEEKKKIDELQYKLKNEIYDSISDYFYAKYYYKIEEDDIMMAYLCNSGFLPEKNIYEKNKDIHEEYTTTNVFPKGYFSEEYEKEHSFVLLEQTNKENNMKHGIKVESVNREEYKEKLENKEARKR